MLSPGLQHTHTHTHTHLSICIVTRSVREGSLPHLREVETELASEHTVIWGSSGLCLWAPLLLSHVTFGKFFPVSSSVTSLSPSAEVVPVQTSLERFGPLLPVGPGRRFSSCTANGRAGLLRGLRQKTLTMGALLTFVRRLTKVQTEGEEGPGAMPGCLGASVGPRRTGAAGLCLSWMRPLIEGSADSSQ